MENLTNYSFDVQAIANSCRSLAALLGEMREEASERDAGVAADKSLMIARDYAVSIATDADILLSRLNEGEEKDND